MPMKKKPNSKFAASKTGQGKPLTSAGFHSSFQILKNEKGSAIVMALVLMVAATMLIVVGVRLLVTMNQQTQQQTLAVAEAENAAKAGLQDATNWFRRQSNTVSYYFPNTGPTPTPQPQFQYIDDAFAPLTIKQDTLDQTIGIVNQYPLNGAIVKLAGTNNLWARYEVRRQSNPAATPGPTATLNPKGVHDITGERIPTALNGQGLVWSLYSTGYIYINNDSNQPYNSAPNKVLASAQMSTEIRKMSFNLPVTAAALAYDMTTISVQGNGILNGGSGYSAAAYKNACGTCYPAVSGTGKISPSKSSVYPNSMPNWVTTNPVQIFGMNPQQLKGVADVTGDGTHNLVFGANQLVYYNGNLTYDPATVVGCYQNNYLNSKGGSCIYVDNGNFTLKPVPAGQIGAYFSGAVFCNGSVTIGEGNTVFGYIMAVNGITVGTGAGGTVDPANLILDPNLITNLNNTVTNYREDKSAEHNFVGEVFR